MKKIILQVEINNIEGWGINWDNELEKTIVLADLSRDVKDALTDGLRLDVVSVGATLDND